MNLVPHKIKDGRAEKLVFLLAISQLASMISAMARVHQCSSGHKKSYFFQRITFSYPNLICSL